MSVISDKDSAITSKDNQIASLNSQISDQNNTISSLNSRISQLDSNITNLQNQVAIQQRILNDLLNVTATVVTVDEITLNASAWLNKTVIVEGKLFGPMVSIPEKMPPGGYIVCRSNETSETPTIFVWVSWNNGGGYNFTNVIVVGIVRFASSGDFFEGGFFIEAESVILL
jgi:uncharacterized coiled-coil protein SlyX